MIHYCKYCGEELEKGVYILKHNTPEIRSGAILEYNPVRDRYEVVNLEEVARYPLREGSYFTFHKKVVENRRYWFKEVKCECNL